MKKDQNCLFRRAVLIVSRAALRRVRRTSHMSKKEAHQGGIFWKALRGQSTARVKGIKQGIDNLRMTPDTAPLSLEH